MGRNIVDFVCLEERLIVEVDGGQHSEQGAYDLERDSWPGKQGFLVLRFSNNEILKEIESVKEGIMNELERYSNTPHLNPPPQGGRKLRSPTPRLWPQQILLRKGEAEGLLSSVR